MDTNAPRFTIVRLQKNYDDVMQVVKHYKITLPDVTWNGDRAEWVTTTTIE